MSRPAGPRPILLNLLISLRSGQWTKTLSVFAASALTTAAGPAELVMDDRPLLVCVGLSGISVILIIYR